MQDPVRAAAPAPSVPAPDAGIDAVPGFLNPGMSQGKGTSPEPAVSRDPGFINLSGGANTRPEPTGARPAAVTRPAAPQPAQQDLDGTRSRRSNGRGLPWFLQDHEEDKDRSSR